jgi:hypothetical protein
MSIEKHDPWALLREAREMLDKGSRSSWDTEVVGELAWTRNRIDAALAAHDGELQDIDRLEARGLKRVWWDAFHQASREVLDLSETERRADAAVDAEARRAAAAAARGLR